MVPPQARPLPSLEGRRVGLARPGRARRKPLSRGRCTWPWPSAAPSATLSRTPSPAAQVPRTAPLGAASAAYSATGLGVDPDRERPQVGERAVDVIPGVDLLHQQVPRRLTLLPALRSSGPCAACAPPRASTRGGRAADATLPGTAR